MPISHAHLVSCAYDKWAQRHMQAVPASKKPDAVRGISEGRELPFIHLGFSHPVALTWWSKSQGLMNVHLIQILHRTTRYRQCFPIQLSHSLSVCLSLSLCLPLSLCLSTLSLSSKLGQPASLSLSHTQTHTHTLSLSLTHTHTHTHSLSLSHAIMSGEER